MTKRCAAFCAAILFSNAVALAETTTADPFNFEISGNLLATSGQGNFDLTVHSPDMLFPIEEGPAFANSQVYRPGGSMKPSGLPLMYAYLKVDSNHP